MKSTLIAAVIVALCAPALAHSRGAGVARLVGISGNVLVSNDYNIASAGERLRLAPGTRVLVTANSAATVEYDDGCRVRLAAGERFEVRDDRPCATGSTHTGGVYATSGRVETLVAAASVR